MSDMTEDRPMSAREDLDRLRSVDPPKSAPPRESAQAQDAGPTPTHSTSMPQGPVSPAQTSSVSVPLELIATRDRMIQMELVRLQRTLSRQNFRGAESARRLVRKLARKALLNVTETESLIRTLS